jgi:hypothetical protein
MRMMSAQDFAVEHPRQKDVVGKLRLAGALGARVDLAEWFADYIERLPVVAVITHQLNIAAKRYKKDKACASSNSFGSLVSFA